MDEVKEGRQRKLLKWVIFVLAIIAIGLAVTIAVIAITGNKDPESGSTSDGGSTRQLSELEKLYVYYTDDVERINTEADRLLEANPTDTYAVEKLYLKQMDLYVTEGATDLIGEFLQISIEQLQAKGLKKEALELIASTDLTPVIGIEKCLVIFDAVSLARELSDNEKLSKFESLSMNTSDGYNNTCSDSSEAKELYNSVISERENI